MFGLFSRVCDAIMAAKGLQEQLSLARASHNTFQVRFNSVES